MIHAKSWYIQEIHDHLRSDNDIYEYGYFETLSCEDKTDSGYIPNIYAPSVSHSACKCTGDLPREV